MTVPTNTVQTFSRVNIREDLSDVISNISPTQTPFMSNIGTGRAAQRLHEWQVDSLAAADATNKTVEGDDASNDTAPASSRRNNYTQLMDKVIQASNTSRAVKNAGYNDELSYQVAKKAKELKRDQESRLCGNYAAVPGSASTAGETAGAVAFMITNASRGSSGAAPTLSGSTSGYPNAAATNGTLRTIAESHLKTVLQLAWNAGGEPSIALASGLIKQTMSTFPGIAAQRRETGNKASTIIGAADVYVSDFGDIAFVPSRFTTGRDVLVLDPSLWKVCDLQSYRMEDLAKTGHSDRKMLLREFTLECQNEAGNGVIADVQA